MPFTISTAEMSPFLSVLWLLAMLACQSTCGIILRDVDKWVCFLLTAYMIQWWLLPCSCCSCLVWSHCIQPLHLMKFALIQSFVFGLTNQSIVERYFVNGWGALKELCLFIVVIIRPFGLWLYVQKHTCYCFVIYTESDTEDGSYLWILIPCAGHLNIMLWLIPYLWQINLDSATCLLLYSLFITRYTVFN